MGDKGKVAREGEKAVRNYLASKYEYRREYEDVKDEKIQTKEIDIIERWKDKDGINHKRALEVKTETRPFGENDKDKYVNKKAKIYDSILSTGCEEYKHGTGNVFIELVQAVGEYIYNKAERCYLMEQAKKYINTFEFENSKVRGWYIVIKDTLDYIKENFTDGRNICFVTYIYAAHKAHTVDEWEKTPLYEWWKRNGHPNELMLEVPQEALIRIVDEELKRIKLNKYWNKLIQISNGTVGIAIPMTKFYSAIQYVDGTTVPKIGRGAPDKATGAMMHILYPALSPEKWEELQRRIAEEKRQKEAERKRAEELKEKN